MTPFLMSVSRRPAAMPSHTFARSFLLLSCLTLLSSLHLAVAQSGVGNDQGTPLPGGHDYILGLNETVTPSNGQVSVRINVPMPKGRNLDIPFYLAYDSNGMYHASPVVMPTNGKNATVNVVLSAFQAPGLFTLQGWTYTVPQYSWQQDILYTQPAYPGGHSEPCSYLHDVMFIDPSGGRHLLNLAWVDPQTQSGCNDYQGQTGKQPTSFSTGTDYQVNAQWDDGGIPSPVVADIHTGTVYTFPRANYGGYTGGGGVGTSSGSLAGQIEDRNGNLINISSESTFPITYTDTANRTALQISSFAGATDTISVAGVAQPYKVTWASLPFTASPPRLNNQHLDGAPPGYCAPVSAPVYSGATTYFPVIQSITFPNGDQYQLQYDQTYGLLKKIIYLPVPMCNTRGA